METVLWLSKWMLAALAAVQATVWGLAELATLYAANHAVQTTRLYDGSVAAGNTDAATVLDLIDGNLVTGRRITVTRDADVATVTITGIAWRVIPFVSIPVYATVSAPVEAPGPAADGLTNTEWAPGGN